MVRQAAQSQLLSWASESSSASRGARRVRYVTVYFGTSWLDARNMSCELVSLVQIVQMLVASVISGALSAVHGDGTDSAGCGK